MLHQFLMILQTEILLKETPDFFKQMMFLMSFNSVFQAVLFASLKRLLKAWFIMFKRLFQKQLNWSKRS